MIFFAYFLTKLMSLLILYSRTLCAEKQKSAKGSVICSVLMGDLRII